MDCNGHVGGVVCNLQCDISCVEVTGLGRTGDARAFFLQCHVPAGGERTIQIDRHHAKADTGGGPTVLKWRDVASLRCDDSPACVRELADRRSVAFELRRWRTVLGRAVGSELVGRAEVAWTDVTAGDTAGCARAARCPGRRCGGDDVGEDERVRSGNAGADDDPPDCGHGARTGRLVGVSGASARRTCSELLLVSRIE